MQKYIGMERGLEIRITALGLSVPSALNSSLSSWVGALYFTFWVPAIRNLATRIPYSVPSLGGPL